MKILKVRLSTVQTPDWPVNLPIDAKLLFVGRWEEDIGLWFQYDPNILNSYVRRQFLVGNDYCTWCGDSFVHLGSVQYPNHSVLHVFEDVGDHATIR